MSLGNGNATEGNKGSNFNYELSVLKLLNNIAIAVTGSACCPTASTEATLSSVLVALQNGREFEQNLVTDLGGVGCPINCPTYLQVRLFNTATNTFDPPIYYTASGAVITPVGPLQLVNPQFVLESISALLTDIYTTVSTSANQVTEIARLTSILGQLDVATSTRASEATLLALNTKFTSVVRTPSLIRVTGAGAATVPAGARTVSVFNAGLNDGSWLGATIKSGEQLTYSADGEDDVLSAFAYDALTTELVITTIV